VLDPLYGRYGAIKERMIGTKWLMVASGLVMLWERREALGRILQTKVSA